MFGYLDYELLMKLKLMYLLPLLLTIIYSNLVFALTFTLPPDGNIVGSIQTTIVTENSSLSQIGRKFDVGLYEMIEANPHLDPWQPQPGSLAIIPTRFIVPDIHSDELVLNLAEMRIYYLHTDQKTITTHPIGIGAKGGAATPLAQGKIIDKKEQPIWTPPQSIRLMHLQQGNVLPEKVLPGPENPLGEYALRLSIPAYMIHGTNRPAGVGVRSSSGCIRLFPEDIKTLFYKVRIGTRVTIIHVPYKIGHLAKNIFLEAHNPLSEPYYQRGFNIQSLIASPHTKDTNLNWHKISSIIEQAHGYPVLVQ